MAWSKLYTVGSDVPVGLQTINQLRDNCEALRDAMAAEHGVGVEPNNTGVGILQPPWQLSPFKAFGKHDDIRIARAVASVLLTDAGEPFFRWASPGCFAKVERYDSGIYLLTLEGGISVQWAKVMPYQQSVGDIYLANCRPFYPASGSVEAPGLYVYTRTASGGTIALSDDFGFQVACYGQVT